MATIARCRLTLHDSLYFATREMGTLYETERYLHNYALAYALFTDTLLARPYATPSWRPEYAEDLSRLVAAGVYVTPARPERFDYLLATYKMAQVDYHLAAERFGKMNYPRNIGRAKELAPESVFEFFIIVTGPKPPALPRWVRLGKWMSKALVERLAVATVEPIAAGPYTCTQPLNPLDLDPATALTLYDVISMPPVSLVVNATLHGPYYELGPALGYHDRRALPAGMRYTFPAEPVTLSRRRR